MERYEGVEVLNDFPDCAILDCEESDDIQELEEIQEDFYFEETMSEVTI